MKPSLLLAVLPLWAAAATPGARLSVPVLGGVFDPEAQTIRVATGVPGAATLDSAVTGSLKAAWVHSGEHIAIAITKDGEIAVVDWSHGASQTKVLATSLTGLRAASWSAGGHAAVLHDGVTAEVWTNIANDPVRVGSYAGDGVVAAAVREDGAAVVATDTGNIFLVTSTETRVIASGGEWKALAFLPDGTDVIAASATEIVRLSGVNENPGQTVLAALDAAPTAIQVAADGTKVAVALARDVLLVGIDGSATKVVCDCAAAGLAPLAGNLVVSLGGSLVLDADAAEPRVFGLAELAGGAQ